MHTTWNFILEKCWDHLADCLDLTFIIDNGGKLSTRPYNKRDDFDFHIVNFPFLSSNIPSGPPYGVYISELIRYAWYCSHYDDFRYRHKCMVDWLLSEGYIALRLEKPSKEILWQTSGSHREIPQVSQGSGVGAGPVGTAIAGPIFCRNLLANF